LIIVIDYGIGNRLSVKNMLEFLGYDCVISNDPDAIITASHIVLPGVGSFDPAMRKLKEDENLFCALEKAVVTLKTPVLGICLGMQLFFERSEEGLEPGLGWISGEVRHLSNINSNDAKIPNMGWADVSLRRGKKDILERFYFAHSYYAVPKAKGSHLYRALFGDEFVCAVKEQNIIGVQFHPEKSHSYGMDFFKRFIEGEL
jgi:glutamine amidotransferase